MRNLKKILALALALVMSMSLMATANAFTDDDSINDTYETAVTVLSGLKVFQGYDDGSFQPQGAITRAQVAAIIYRIVTGDVADTQVGIYADYNKFDDVASTSWYAGYVNFCANAEYIKGYDARTFGPNDPVTGYQALAMILRALGYDKNGEFTGTNWTIQTAAVGENRGITKNISAGTLGTAASREVVAEILFRAILVEKVNYTPAFGYQLDDTSIGWDTFELEEIEGVVVANEYADLYDTEPLKAGKTELDVDGESYTVDYTTTLEDIGEARAAYITEGKTVLAIGDAGNTVYETGDEVDISTSKKFEDVTGMSRSGAEHFVNFDGGTTYEASDYRIGYIIAAASIDVDTAEEAAFKAANGGEFSYVDGVRVYEKDIRRGAALTSTDMDIIEMIFDNADRHGDTIEMGEVYVGTQSNDDISDDISYTKFLDEYIETSENSVEVLANENGNWLKVIDNDGDGEADVVLKTIYTFTLVDDINRDGDIELAALYVDLDKTDDLNTLTKNTDVVSADELAEGDVVYYAVIDGNAQTYKAEMVTAEIDKVNRKTLTATTTDGDEYVESAVHNHTDDAYYDDGVVNLTGSTSYDLYLDKFGYLGVFTETTTTGDFVLLTDGWYMSQRTGDEYAAMVWDREEQKLVDTDITDGGDLFISDADNNHWGQLKYFDGINDDGLPVHDDIHTIVAALNEEGELSPVESVYNKRTINIVATDDNEIPENAYTAGTAYTTTRNSDDAYDNDFDHNVEIRALSTTVYYYVYEDAKGNTIVNEYVGYKNIPELDASEEAKIEDVYAVGTLTDRESGLGDSQYYAANVVVVEFAEAYRSDAEEIFLVEAPEVGKGITLDNVRVIRNTGAEEYVTIDLDASNYATYGEAGDVYVRPGLYYMWPTTEEGVYTISVMSNEDIADSKYAVGQVSTSLGTIEEDYVGVTEFTYISDIAIAGYNTGVEDMYRLTEDSHVYTLGYDIVTNRDHVWYEADLDAEADADAVLDERVDISREQDADQANYDTANRLYWNNNDVLVAYNKDGDIIYAISFNNYNEDMDLIPPHADYAQFVWNFCKPAAEVPSDLEQALANAEDLLGKEDPADWTWTDVTIAERAIDVLEATGNSAYVALAEDLEALKEAAKGLLTGAGTLATAKADALAMLAANTANDPAAEGYTNDWSGWTAGMIDAVEAWIAEQTDATVLTEGEMANVAEGIQDAQNAAKDDIEDAGAAANTVKAGTIASAVEEKAAVEALSTTEAIDAYVAEVTNSFAQAVVDAVVEAIGEEAAMASPADATADNVKTVITNALVTAGFTLTDTENEVTISVADPESSTDVGVTTRTAEVTVQYGELSAKTTVTLTQRSGN